MAEEKVTLVDDMVERIHAKVDEEFEEEKSNQLRVRKKKDYFICKNRFWDLWWQKLFTQIISIKVWVLALITVLLIKEVITATMFSALFGVIMGFKGAFEVADAFKGAEDPNRAIHMLSKQ